MELVAKPSAGASKLTETAREILSGMLAEYDKRNGFKDDVHQEGGLVYHCAGTVALLLILNTFSDIEVDKTLESLISKEFNEVYQYVTTKGYDATPYVPAAVKGGEFPPSGNFHYCDSLSWVLALTLQLRYAQRMAEIDMKDDVVRVRSLLVDTLRKISEAACPGGGWNFTAGCKEPSLYFSYAVSEALADLGDYVLGETKEIATEDIELVKQLGGKDGELLKAIEQSRKATAQWLIETYLPQLGREELMPRGFQDDNPERKLYFTYFVLEMLVVNKADEFFPEKAGAINKAIEHGIYLSRIDFDRAKDNTTWWTDPERSSLPIEWGEHASIKFPARYKKNLLEPGLVPLSLRCNGQYTYYIAKGEDRKMKLLFNDLLSNRNPDNQLWDESGYSLIVTERAVEALIDFYDYLSNIAGRDVPSIPADAPTNLDAYVENLVRKTVRAALESHTVNPSPEITKQSEKRAVRDILADLKDALAEVNYALSGTPNEDTEQIVSGIAAQIRELAGNLLFESLNRPGFDKDKQTELRIAMPKAADDLANELGAYLTKPLNVSLSDVFTWATQKCADQKAKQ